MIAPSPTKEEALQLCIMLQSGIPQREAIRYFVPEGYTASEGELAQMHNNWLGSRNVKSAMLVLQGKPWQEMSLEERIVYAIDKHYSELAYFLYSRNYAELGAQDRQKADICRTTLESRQAGLAGKTDALSKFFTDLQSGVLKLPSVAPGRLPSKPS